MDHINHVTFSKSPLSISSVYILEKIVKEIIKWIDEEHPDYALALVSDHGGQTFPLDETLNQHGSNVNGNEGIFTIYTKDLGDNFDKLKYNVRTISRYDYATTFPQIIEGINIPLNSIGKPLILGNDNIFRFSAVKSKEEQVISFPAADPAFGIRGMQ